MFKFGRGKNKGVEDLQAALNIDASSSANPGERSVEQQTLQRWRGASDGRDFESGPAQAAWGADGGEFVRVIKKGKNSELAQEAQFAPRPGDKQTGKKQLGEHSTFDEAIPEAMRPQGVVQKGIVQTQSEFTEVSQNQSPSVSASDSQSIPEIVRHGAQSPVPQIPDAQLAPEEELQRRFGANIKTALGPGTVIEGKFSFEAPVRIDGTLSGEVSSTSALIVGEEATVDAKIRVGSLVVFGEVSGEIEADELVEVKSGGKLTASIKTGSIVIDEGGFFEGGCNCTIIS